MDIASGFRHNYKISGKAVSFGYIKQVDSCVMQLNKVQGDSPWEPNEGMIAAVVRKEETDPCEVLRWGGDQGNVWEAGLGLRDLAFKSNISPSMLKQIENGSANPSITTLKNIAVVLVVFHPVFHPVLPPT